MTEKAAKGIINQLVKFEKNQIGSAAEAINISIMNGWKGVFEPRRIYKSVKDVKLDKHEQERQQLRDYHNKQQGAAND